MGQYIFLITVKLNKGFNFYGLYFLHPFITRCSIILTEIPCLILSHPLRHYCCFHHCSISIAKKEEERKNVVEEEKRNNTLRNKLLLESSVPNIFYIFQKIHSGKYYIFFGKFITDICFRKLISNNLIQIFCFRNSISKNLF